MAKNIAKKVNGGLAIYYGIGFIVAVVIDLGFLSHWCYRILMDEISFSWGTLTIGLVIAAVAGTIGYVLLKIGYSELEQ